MPVILHIETATDVCSIGISRGDKLLALHESLDFNNHAARITLMIEACMQDAQIQWSDLDAIAISSGPGSYTGLRIGVSTAKGICYAQGKPLIAIDTLQTLALAAHEASDPPNTLYCPMIDARRMEVYAAIFDVQGNLVQPPAAIRVEHDTFQSFFAAGRTLIFSGNGAEKCKPFFTVPQAHFRSVLCSAKHLIQLAVQAFQKKKFADVAYFEPFYLKPPNITTPIKNKSLR